MSENLKKLREEEKKVTYWETPGGKEIARIRTMKGWETRRRTEDLERKAEEARKEEQRIKDEIKRTEEEQLKEWKELKKKTLIELSDFSRKIRKQKAEEESAYTDYMKLSKEAPIVPTYTRILEEIAMQEKKHGDTLTSLLSDIETKIRLLQKELQIT